MKVGHVRDNLPRIVLALPTLDGMVNVEFIVDTGFDGELALPLTVMRQIDAEFATERLIRLAEGGIRRRACYEVNLDWNDEERLTEILLLEGNPLLGSELLIGSLVHIEMTNGGEVTIEPL